MIKLVIDTLGSDNGYIPSVKGSIRALNEIDDLYLVLAGHKDEILELLSTLNYDKSRVEILDSKEEINNHDHPVEAIKNKKESSLVKSLNYLKENDDALGLVNASSTGALLAGSTLIVGRIGRMRPAMATLLPNDKGQLTVLTDCGANIDPRPDQVLNFAIMGSALAKAILEIPEPKIAILSNGSEEGKGNELTKESYQLIKESSLNFIGNKEGNDALDGEANVIVSDGFSGNVFLKTVEGSAKIIIKEIFKMAKMESNPQYQELGQKLIKRYDFTSLGGAILVGVNKVIVKGHGNANEDTWYACTKLCYKVSKNNLVENIKTYL